MIEALIAGGDHVVIRPQQTTGNGGIPVAARAVNDTVSLMLIHRFAQKHDKPIIEFAQYRESEIILTMILN